LEAERICIRANASASNQKAIDKFTAGKMITDVFKQFLLFFILIWLLPIEDGESSCWFIGITNSFAI
jgi:hypothetical protein